MRIVSLLPSATEIVHALGRGGDLVGRSAECDFPPDVRRLPVVMRARTLDADRSSDAIDARVRSALRSGESLYDLDVAALAELRPDVILTQDLCRVCSVTDDEVRDGCRRAGVRPRIVSLAPTRLEEVWASIAEIGEVIGAGEPARRFVAELRRRTELPPPNGPPRRVAVLEWLDPPILSGLWTPDVLQRAGCVGFGPKAGGTAQQVRWEDLRGADLDVLIVSPCSFRIDRSRDEIEGTPGLREELVRLRPPLGLWLADEAYFSRPGPRLVDGVELVRALTSGAVPSGPMPVARWAPLERAS